jgi:DNA-binding MarR family transcriptional regulator
VPDRLATPDRPLSAGSDGVAVQAVRAVVRASRLLERASDELNLAHYRVLSAIASGDERASRIAHRLALGKPTVSAAVDALCQRGLLTRSKSQADQRVAALQLTSEGRAVLARVEEAMVARLDDLCSRSPDPEQLLSSLVSIGAAVDDLVAQRRPVEGR